jgi:hypothetical protein
MTIGADQWLSVEPLAHHGWKNPIAFWFVVAGVVVIGVLIYLVRNAGKWWK